MFPLLNNMMWKKIQIYRCGYRMNLEDDGGVEKMMRGEPAGNPDHRWNIIQIESPPLTKCFP